MTPLPEDGLHTPKLCASPQTLACVPSLRLLDILKLNSRIDPLRLIGLSRDLIRRADEILNGQLGPS